MYLDYRGFGLKWETRFSCCATEYIGRSQALVSFIPRRVQILGVVSDN